MLRNEPRESDEISSESHRPGVPCPKLVQFTLDDLDHISILIRRVTETRDEWLRQELLLSIVACLDYRRSMLAHRLRFQAPLEEPTPLVTVFKNENL